MTPAMERLRQREDAVSRVGSFEPALRFVLARGHQFKQATLAAADREYVRECAKRAGCRSPEKQCYANAQRILLTGDISQRLQYAEGYAITPEWEIPHGWLVLDRKVIDTTLRNFGTWRDLAYVGVEFSREDVHQRVFRARAPSWGSLLDDPEGGWPWLKENLP